MSRPQPSSFTILTSHPQIPPKSAGTAGSTEHAFFLAFASLNHVCST
jgi:hypothetical protein